MLTEKEINNFKVNGAVFLEKKFDVRWIKKLKPPPLAVSLTGAWPRCGA